MKNCNRLIKPIRLNISADDRATFHVEPIALEDYAVYVMCAEPYFEPNIGTEPVFIRTESADGTLSDRMPVIDRFGNKLVIGKLRRGMKMRLGFGSNGLGEVPEHFVLFSDTCPLIFNGNASFQASALDSNNN